MKKLNLNNGYIANTVWIIWLSWGEKKIRVFQQLKIEQNYPSFRLRLFLSIGNKDKTGNEVTFDSHASDVVDHIQKETD